MEALGIWRKHLFNRKKRFPGLFSVAFKNRNENIHFFTTNEKILTHAFCCSLEDCLCIVYSTCEATLIHKHNECVISDVFAIEYTQGEVQLWLRSLNLNIEVKGRKRSPLEITALHTKMFTNKH